MLGLIWVQTVYKGYHRLHARIQRGPDPPGKNTSYIGFLWNKQLDHATLGKSWDTPPPGKNVGPPLEPWKLLIFFEINHWTSVKEVED